MITRFEIINNCFPLKTDDGMKNYTKYWCAMIFSVVRTCVRTTLRTIDILTAVYNSEYYITIIYNRKNNK